MKTGFIQFSKCFNLGAQKISLLLHYSILCFHPSFTISGSLLRRIQQCSTNCVKCVGVTQNASCSQHVDWRPMHLLIPHWFVPHLSPLILYLICYFKAMIQNDIADAGMHSQQRALGASDLIYYILNAMATICRQQLKAR